MKTQGFGSGRLVLTPKIYRDIPIDSQGIVSYTTLTLLKQLIAELNTLVGRASSRTVPLRKSEGLVVARSDTHHDRKLERPCPVCRAASSSLTRNCSPLATKRCCSKSLTASSPVCWSAPT